MNTKKEIVLFACVALFAASICVYAVLTDGWESAKSTVYITAGLWGGISLFWFLYSKRKTQ